MAYWMRNEFEWVANKLIVIVKSGVEEMDKSGWVRDVLQVKQEQFPLKMNSLAIILGLTFCVSICLDDWEPLVSWNRPLG